MNIDNLIKSMNLTQIKALRHLCAHPGTSASELCRAADVSPAAITGLKDKFVIAGLMTEARHPVDRRKVHLHPTELGREALRKLDRMLAA